MKNLRIVKVLIVLFVLAFTQGQTQIIVKLGSALLQNAGTDVSLPVTVQGLNSATGGMGITALELHISYNNNSLIYDTTVNFTPLMPVPQWFFGGNGLEYSTNWIEPLNNKLNIPDNTVLFDIVFHYNGGTTELNFDTARCLLIDSAFNIIPGVQYVNATVTPSQGSGESRWNGTGAWNTLANWSNGIPGDSTDAIIETGMVTILSNASCRNLTINSSTQVMIAPDYSLSVNRDYINNGSLEMRSDATGTGSLIAKGTVTGSGVNHFNRHLALNAENAHLVSSPVTGATTAVFSSNQVDRYAEGTASWQVASPGETLQTGTGYRVSGSTPSTANFQGMFNSGNVTLNNLSFTASGQPEIRGLNLAGNPYPSAIQLEQGNWGRVNLDRAVYVWQGYKYVTWNGSTGALQNGIIPAMQGFFVKSNAAGGSLTIPSGSRLHSTLPFYKSVEAITDQITLKLENSADAEHFDEAFVHILNGTSGGFDAEHDAWKLQGNVAFPQIWTTATDQGKLSINTKADMVSVPVEVQTGVTGTYKITFSNFETFNSTQPLFFEDKSTNSVINIRNTGMYVFTSTGTSETGRFVLHFQEVGLAEASSAGFRVWHSGDVLRITTTGIDRIMEEIELLSMTGHVVRTEKNAELPASIRVEQLPAGLYILKIRTSTGVYTQKLVVR